MRRKFFLIAIAFLCGSYAWAQECQIPVSVSVDPVICNVSEDAGKLLTTRLQQLARQDQMDVTWKNSDFLLTAKFNLLDKRVVDGVPVKVMNDYEVTLMVVDATNQKIFASQSIPVKGLGDNENKAALDAVKRLNSSNSLISQFMSNAKQDIINYYDGQADNLIKQAQVKADMKEYPEAIYKLIVIPTCCKNYDKAVHMALQIYQSYLDDYNLNLFNHAKEIWSANPSPEGGKSAAAILAEVDPKAKCYDNAIKLMDEIGKQVKADYVFDTRDKYKDEVELNKLRVQAVTEIAKGFAATQPKTEINVIDGHRF